MLQEQTGFFFFLHHIIYQAVKPPQIFRLLPYFFLHFKGLKLNTFQVKSNSPNWQIKLDVTLCFIIKAWCVQAQSPWHREDRPASSRMSVRTRSRGLMASLLQHLPAQALFGLFLVSFMMRHWTSKCYFHQWEGITCRRRLTSLLVLEASVVPPAGAASRPAVAWL